MAAIPQPYVFRPAEAEIAEVLEIPVAALMDPSVLERRDDLPGARSRSSSITTGNSVIWGATARMIAELLEALQ